MRGAGGLGVPVPSVYRSRLVGVISKAVLNKTAALDPEVVSIIHELGCLACKQGDLDEMDAYFQNAIPGSADQASIYRGTSFSIPPSYPPQVPEAAKTEKQCPADSDL
jgi:hypothetical protein